MPMPKKFIATVVTVLLFGSLSGQQLSLPWVASVYMPQAVGQESLFFNFNT